MNLSDLKEQERGNIIALRLSKQDAKRLFYLGVYPGAILQFVQCAPCHDPLLFYVQGAFLIMRRKDAKRVEVERI